ncbi:MAG: methyltransferase domain-containing protein [Acidimicrobiales bacterium]|nr:methyltransferase domain-containing protein [Acidimicrobiales bacterium]
MEIDEVAARGFEAGAAAYELARPGYPDEAVAILAGPVGIGPGAVVCDLAAGTGKLTRRLVELQASVMAVEPVPGMRAQLQAVLPAIEVVEGTAEAIPLPDASVEVVTVAQAFHWFDAATALTEIARVLQPGGRVVLLWNERDEATPWVAEMSRLIRWHERTVSRYQHVDWADVVAESGRFTPLEETAIDWDQSLTRDLLADRVRSISYIAAMPGAPRERLAAEVVSLVSRLPEPFPMPYRCRIQWARLR